MTRESERLGRSALTTVTASQLDWNCGERAQGPRGSGSLNSVDSAEESLTLTPNGHSARKPRQAREELSSCVTNTTPTYTN